MTRRYTLAVLAAVCLTMSGAGFLAAGCTAGEAYAQTAAAPAPAPVAQLSQEQAQALLLALQQQAGSASPATLSVPTAWNPSWDFWLKALGVILSTALSVLGAFAWWTKLAKNKEEWYRWMTWAYNAATEFAAMTPNAVDDLIAKGLGVARDALGAELNKKELLATSLLVSQAAKSGLGTVTPELIAQARAIWTGMSGSEKVAAQVNAKAATLALATSAATEERPADPAGTIDTNGQPVARP